MGTVPLCSLPAAATPARSKGLLGLITEATGSARTWICIPSLGLLPAHLRGGLPWPMCSQRRDPSCSGCASSPGQLHCQEMLCAACLCAAEDLALSFPHEFCPKSAKLAEIGKKGMCVSVGMGVRTLVCACWCKRKISSIWLQHFFTMQTVPRLGTLVLP